MEIMAERWGAHQWLETAPGKREWVLYKVFPSRREADSFLKEDASKVESPGNRGWGVMLLEPGTNKPVEN